MGCCLPGHAQAEWRHGARSDGFVPRDSFHRLHLRAEEKSVRLEELRE